MPGDRMRLSVIVSLLDRLTGPAGKMVEALTRTETTTEKLEKQLEKMRAPVADVAGAMDDAGSTTAKLEKQLDKMSGPVRDAHGRFLKAGQAADVMGGRLDHLARDARGLAPAMAAAGDKVGAVGAPVQGTEARVSRLAAALRRVQGASTKAAGGIQAFKKHVVENQEALDRAALRLGATGAAITGVGSKMRSGLEAVVAPALAVEKGMSQVFTLMPKAPTEDIEKLTGEFRAFQRMSFSESESNITALYKAISKGVDPGKSVEFLRAMEKAGVAGASNTEQATGLATTVMAAYGLSIEETVGAMDQMQAAVRLGDTTLDQLASSIGQIASLAKNSNVPLSQLTAGISQLSLEQSTAESVTALRSMIQGMAAPVGGARKAMEKLGGEALLAAGKAGDIVKVTEILAAKLPKEGRLAAIRELFPDIEAAKAVSSLTSKIDDLKAKHADISTSAGEVGVAYDRMAQVGSNKLAQAKNQLLDVGITLGQKIVPHLVEAIPHVTALADRFGAWMAANPELVQMGINVALWGTAIATVLGPLMLVGSAVLGFTSSLITFAQAAGPAVKFVLKFGKWLRVLMGPVGIIAAGFVSWVSVINTIRENWGLLMDEWGPTIERVKTFLREVLQAFSDLGGKLKDMGGGLLTAFGDGIKSTVGYPLKVLGGAAGQLRDLLTGSDAKTGPLSTVTAGGRALPETFAAGMSKGAPGGIAAFNDDFAQPLARVLQMPSMPTAMLPPPRPSRAGSGSVVQQRGDTTIDLTVNVYGGDPREVQRAVEKALADALVRLSEVA